MENLFNEHGSFRICRKGKDFCSKWFLYSEASELIKINCNLRELCKDEIVLDIEEKEKAEPIIKTLQADGIFFKAYYTGSRGVHIHIFFPEMIDWSEEKIKKAREWFIKKFETDTAKKSGVIAIENEPHFKTGNKKTLFFDYCSNGLNTLPVECVEYVNETKTSQTNKINIDVFEGCRLLNFALTNKLQEHSGRGFCLFKNCAIYLVNKYDFKTATFLWQQLHNVQNKNYMLGWLSWAKENKKKDFSCAELRKWLRETKQENVEQMTCWKCKWK